MRVVFMGNPEFAIPTLKLLQKSRHELLAVVSNKPKPMGRGRILESTPVGKFAKKNKIKLLEPDNLNAIDFKNQLKNLEADIFLVVAYRILPEKIIGIPKHGAINLHVSLLPKYRGAAPIQWALMNGDTETGVTIFQINRKVDTGDILVQKKFPIYKDDNMLTLGTRLCNSGAEIMIDAIGKIEEGSIEILKQTQESVSFAPKITKKMRCVNWNWSAIKIHNWVRGLSPYPSMYTFLNGKIIKVFKTFIKKSSIHKPGEIIKINHDTILIGTGNNLLGLLEIQLEGKKKLLIKEYLKGSPIDKKWIFGK
jgi:methionyl-tRNA formyltransferase